ncbi:MAG: HAMP domain-containing protein [Ramlibacter sp.]|nr:HAMP domain-containing protein [Ramlibacter sp.]
MIKNLPLWARLAAAFATVLVLLLGVAGAGVWQVQTLEGLDATQQRLTTQRRAVVDWVGLTRLNVVRTLSLARAGSPPALAQWMDVEMKSTSGRISEVQKQLEASFDTQAEKNLMIAVAAARKSYIELRVSLLKRLAARGDAAQAMAEVESQLTPAAAAYLRSLENVLAAVDERAAAQRTERARTIERGLIALAALTAGAIAIGALLAWRVSRSLVVPLREAQATAQRIADSDLTYPVQVNRHDEIGDLQSALARMQESLRVVVNGIRDGTESFGAATNQIASGNLDLSTRTERAASSLQQTAATMAQLAEGIAQSAGSAATAHGLASAASEVARRGGEVVTQVVATMAEINAGSNRIGDITSVIDSIAFQTNILALNAAVEAARAGEQGRGFAVVAGEVRSLAARSADAAREIRALIESNVQKAEAGSRLVASAGATMNEIEQSVGQVSHAIAEVTQSASTQATGIAEVNRAVAQLDDITQQNAALVEEASAAAESLKDQAGALARMVATFRLQPALA